MSSQQIASSLRYSSSTHSALAHSAYSYEEASRDPASHTTGDTTGRTTGHTISNKPTPASRSSSGSEEAPRAVPAEAGSMRTRVEEELGKLDKDLDLAVEFAAELTKSKSIPILYPDPYPVRARGVPIA